LVDNWHPGPEEAGTDVDFVDPDGFVRVQATDRPHRLTIVTPSGRMACVDVPPSGTDIDLDTSVLPNLVLRVENTDGTPASGYRLHIHDGERLLRSRYILGLSVLTDEAGYARVGALPGDLVGVSSLRHDWAVQTEHQELVQRIYVSKSVGHAYVIRKSAWPTFVRLRITGAKNKAVLDRQGAKPDVEVRSHRTELNDSDAEEGEGK
jgi:hypothetical protein